MNINPTYKAYATDPSATSNNSDSSTSDMFLQLLTTQLKNQSPLDPMDPSQFVNQLVQFNTLNQIIGIRDLLEQFSTTPASTSSSTAPVQGGQ